MAGLSVVLGLALGLAYFLAGRRMGANYEVAEVIAIETGSDSATLVLGAHVADVPHEGPLATVTGVNLTAGEARVASLYRNDSDWVHAIRHGVRPDGSPLIVMPSYEYRGIGPEALGAWVSWIKSMPPVNTDHADQRLGPLGTVLFLAGQLPLLPAEMIDHDTLSAADFSQPAVGVTAVCGEYIALSCPGGVTACPMQGLCRDFSRSLERSS